jgi:Ca2+-binding EF-hand superfamily protein/CRP-like cAMP-binding protein
MPCDIGLGLTPIGLTGDDTVATLEEKFVAVHLFTIIAALQLVSLTTWSNDIAIAVYAVITVIAAGFGFVWFALHKRHDAFRSLTMASGFAYVVGFFVSEGCQPLTASNGRLVPFVLPTVIAHIPTGGSPTVFACAWAAHAVWYLALAIIEPLAGRCYKPVGTPAIHHELGLGAIQAVVPTFITLACCGFVLQRSRVKLLLQGVADFHAANARDALVDGEVDALWAMVEDRTAALGADGGAASEVETLAWEALHALLTLGESVPIHDGHRTATTDALSFSMIPMIQTTGPFTAIGALAESMQQIQLVAGESSGARRDSLQSAPAQSPPAFHRKRSSQGAPGSSNPVNSSADSLKREQAKPSGSASDDDDDLPAAAVMAGGDSPASKLCPAPQRRISIVEAEPVSHSGLTFRSPNGLRFSEQRSPQPFGQGAMRSPKPKVTKVCPDAFDHSRLGRHGSLRRQRNVATTVANRRPSVALALSSAPHTYLPPRSNPERRLSTDRTTASIAPGTAGHTAARKNTQVVADKKFICMFTLPHLAAYQTAQNGNIDIVRAILTTHTEIVVRCAALFSGSLLSRNFADFYFAFDTCAKAISAAYVAIELTKDTDKYYTDPTAKRLQPFAAAAFVMYTEVHSGVQNNGRHMFCAISAMPNLIALQNFAAMADLPAVFVPDTVAKLVDGDFSLVAATNGVKRIRNAFSEGLDKLPEVTNTMGYEAELGDVFFHDDNIVVPCEYCLDKSMDSSTAGASTRVPPGRTRSRASSMMSRPSHAQARRALGPAVMELWNLYDVDRNGTLDRDEIRHLLDDLGMKLTTEEFAEFFDTVDTDGSNEISLHEFANGFTSPTLGAAKAIAVLQRHVNQLSAEAALLLVERAKGLFMAADKKEEHFLETKVLHKILKDLHFDITYEEVTWVCEKLDSKHRQGLEVEEFLDLFDVDAAQSNRVIEKRQRVQMISRVIENQATTDFSTDDQVARDNADKFDQWFYAVFSPLLAVYVLWAFGSASYLAALAGVAEVPRGLIIFNFAFDAIPWGWVALKFCVLPQGKDGQIIHRRRDVIAQYCRSLGFVVDVIALIPCDIYPAAASGGNVYGYFRLNKVLLLFHLGFLMGHTFRKLGIGTARVIMILVWYLCAAVTFGCAMIVTARVAGEEAVADAVGSESLLASPSDRFVSFYWAVMHLCGQFRGQTIPDSDHVLVLLYAVLFVGVPLFAAVLGTIGNYINTVTRERAFLNRINGVRSYFQYASSRMGMSEARELEQHCIAYYRHLFETTGSLDIAANPLTDVPVEIGIRSTIEAGLAILTRVPIFKEACENVEFVHEISVKMVPRVIEPATVVMRKGERGSNMYFITYGDFNIVVDGVGVVFTLRKGNFFGEIALLHNVKRTATIVCDERRYANVLTLEKRDFDEVLQTFPTCLSAISAAAADRLKQILEQEADEQRSAKQKRRDEGLLDVASRSVAAVPTPTSRHVEPSLTGNPLANVNASFESNDGDSDSLEALEPMAALPAVVPM